VARNKVRHVDIARDAGVSVATVDRVLNGRSGVNERTARLVWDTMETLQGQNGPSPQRKRANLRFDLILPAGTNTFVNMLEAFSENVGSAMTDADVTVCCHRVEGFNPAMLADCIRTIGAGSDGIALMALENPAVREAVNAVIEAGTPVVTLVSDLSTTRKIGYVGINNQAAGRTAAYLMSRFLSGRKGSVAVIEGSLDLSYSDHQEREFGFRNALREYAPMLDLIGRWETQDNFEEAHNQTLKLLDSHPDVLGIYGISGGIRGVAQALKEREMANRIVCIGHDLTPFTRQFLLDGTVDAILHQNAEKEVRTAIRVLTEHHLTGGTRSAPDHLKMDVFFRENLP